MSRTAFVESSPLTREALDLASHWHEGQTRETGGIPFVTHPVEVACLLHEAGYSDDVVAAGVLHDVIEETDANQRELEERFGSNVADLVAAVSDDPSIDDEARRKAALREQVAQAGESAVAVFAADKVSKARELRLRVEEGRFRRKDRAKLDHYQASLEMLDELMPGHQLVDRLRAELDAVHALP
jgi:(p)ppGpp synthase/HD superfamily hydrolase